MHLHSHTYTISQFFINSLSLLMLVSNFLFIIDKMSPFFIPFIALCWMAVKSIHFFDFFPVFHIVNILQCRVFHTCVVIFEAKFLEGRLLGYRVNTLYILICIAQIVSRNKGSTDYIFTNMAGKCPWEPRLFWRYLEEMGRTV